MDKPGQFYKPSLCFQIFLKYIYSVGELFQFIHKEPTVPQENAGLLVEAFWDDGVTW